MARRGSRRELGELPVARRGVGANRHLDAFPATWPLLIHEWIALAGGSDASLRALGALIAIAGLAALSWTSPRQASAVARRCSRSFSTPPIPASSCLVARCGATAWACSHSSRSWGRQPPSPRAPAGRRSRSASSPRCSPPTPTSATACSCWRVSLRERRFWDAAALEARGVGARARCNPAPQPAAVPVELPNHFGMDRHVTTRLHLR